ncbi:hypothetical protein F5Y19DRAFT_157180 [Xylariaceae sp. FL1651]|nr:hypothetical protein F5Y19DRAFT_157180 [Xylariaceae sp. FL1651]
MFFEGSLQDGISIALQQSKQVVCFVTNGENESRQWENEFLMDDSVKSGLESQSIVLKLPAGSEEAGFLEALFPVPKKPTVVVIQNGQLKEYIASGTSKEEFIRRLTGTLLGANQSQSPAPSISTPAAAAPRPSQSSALSERSRNDDDLYDGVSSSATPTGSSITSQGPRSSATEEEKRATAKGKGKARAEAEEEARRRVDERCGCEPANPEQAHANEVKQRKQQANEERKRILKRIEDDKRARKEREAEERRARQLLSTDVDGENPGNTTTSIPLAQQLPKAGQGDHCNLQVRLLDGSTIRSRFPSDKTLNHDVRKWIDDERTDGNTPYAFRVVLTPLPNKVIEPQEEIKSLLSLGLAPSATLVLIPTKYSAAYAQAGGVVSQGLNPIIGLFTSLYGAIIASLGGIFTMFFGSQNAQRSEQGEVPMENLRAARDSRVRGFQNSDDRRRDAQLYNGNSLNFEPRNDDEDESNTR